MGDSLSYLGGEGQDQGDEWRSEQSGYSRFTLYMQAERVVQAGVNEPASGISDEDLWAEHEAFEQVTVQVMG
jgi:hypothetical protein